MLDGDHIQNAARKQRPVAHVLHQGKFAARPHGAPLLVIFVELQVPAHALPLPDRGGILVLEMAREAVVESDDPARPDHSGVADHLQIAFAGHHRFRRRQIAEPQRRVAPSSHRSHEACIGVDPGCPRRSRFRVSILHHLDAGPDALIRRQNRRRSAEFQPAARSQFDDWSFRVCQRIPHPCCRALGEIPFEYDSRKLGSHRLTGRIRWITARRDDRKSGHSALAGAFRKCGNRFRLGGIPLHQEAVDWRALQQVKSCRIGPRPAGGHPVRGNSHRQHESEKHTLIVASGLAVTHSDERHPDQDEEQS